MNMRYRIIVWERECFGNMDVNQQIAAFRHSDDAIKVCSRLGVPAYGPLDGIQMD